MKKPTISVSMIVKNEEKILQQCLETIKQADEIIIIDTGSSDNTIQIAKQYTTKIYSGPEYQWKDDFAHSRNQSLKQCTSDYILIIDADETLEEGGIEQLKKLLAEQPTTNSFNLTLQSKTGKETFHNTRIFKNNEGIEWKGRVHNYLNIHTTNNLPVTITYGYSPAHAQDPDRALRILKSVLEENPLAVRETYYLAREYFYRKDYNNAIKHYNDYLTRGVYGAEIADTHLMLCYCYQAIGDNNNARDSALRAVFTNTNFREAIKQLIHLSGPINKKRWSAFLEGATNDQVLFKRGD